MKKIGRSIFTSPILHFIIMGFIVTGTGISVAGEHDKALKPNFVFILVDDMGWTGLSVPMHDGIASSKSDFYRTPHLAKLAEQSLRFSNAYAPAPMCTPSRASFLTGKSPAQLHMTTPGRARKAASWQKISPPNHIHALPGEEVTIAEILQSHGYATAHFGKWHLAGGGPGKHGFDAHDGETGNKGPGLYGDPNPKDIFGMTERASAFMTKQVRAGKPFYLQVSHYAVHSPKKALKQTMKRFDGFSKGKRHSDVEYASMTADLDSSLGIILAKISDLDIAGNTYVVFMSDNGAAARPRNPENTPLSGGKGSLWEGGIRVPLIIRGPGIVPGGFSHTGVIGYDLFPTFWELAGIRDDLPKDIEGTSLTSLFRGGRGDAFERRGGAMIFHYPHYGLGPNQVPQSAIRAGNFKLIYFYETGERRLFDLEQDIAEKNDLAEEKTEQTADVYNRLTAYLRRVGAQFPTNNSGYDPEAKRQTGTQRRAGNRFILRWDQDGDNRVSQEEFTGPSRRFNNLDKNGDGYLFEDEAPKGAPSSRR